MHLILTPNVWYRVLAMYDVTSLNTTLSEVNEDLSLAEISEQCVKVPIVRLQTNATYLHWFEVRCALYTSAQLFLEDTSVISPHT